MGDVTQEKTIHFSDEALNKIFIDVIVNPQGLYRPYRDKHHVEDRAKKRVHTIAALEAEAERKRGKEND